MHGQGFYLILLQKLKTLVYISWAVYMSFLDYHFKGKKYVSLKNVLGPLTYRNIYF